MERSPWSLRWPGPKVRRGEREPRRLHFRGGSCARVRPHESVDTQCQPVCRGWPRTWTRPAWGQSLAKTSEKPSSGLLQAVAGRGWEWPREPAGARVVPRAARARTSCGLRRSALSWHQRPRDAGRRAQVAAAGAAARGGGWPDHHRPCGVAPPRPRDPIGPELATAVSWPSVTGLPLASMLAASVASFLEHPGPRPFGQRYRLDTANGVSHDRLTPLADRAQQLDRSGR